MVNSNNSQRRTKLLSNVIDGTGVMYDIGICLRELYSWRIVIVVGALRMDSENASKKAGLQGQNGPVHPQSNTWTSENNVSFLEVSRYA